MPKKVSVIVILICLWFSACNQNYEFDKYQAIGNTWNKNQSIQFNFLAPDSIHNYNLFINLRNTKDYRYNNLFLIAELNYPNGKIVIDTLEYQMAKPNGEFLGTGFSDLKENKLWYKGYKERFTFEELGEYKLILKQAMRRNGDVEGIKELEGITDIGFRIEALTQHNDGN